MPVSTTKRSKKLPEPFLSCKPLPPEPGTPFDISGKREYKRKWRVTVRATEAGKSVGPVQACFCPGIARPFSSYQSYDGKEYDLFSLCVRLEAELENKGDWQHWIVIASYSNDIPNDFELPEATSKGNETNPQQESGNPQNNPEMKAPEIKWDVDVIEIAPETDLDGKKWQLSNQQPIHPSPTIPIQVPVLVYTRNENIFGRANVVDWGYTLNSDNFLGAKPGWVECSSPTAVQERLGARLYWRVTYKFRFKNDMFEWDPSFLDASTHELGIIPGAPPFVLPGPNGINVFVPRIGPIPIMEFEQNVTTPVLLDGKGRRQMPNNQGKLIPIYNKFRTHRRKRFGDLMLRGI